MLNPYTDKERLFSANLRNLDKQLFGFTDAEFVMVEDLKEGGIFENVAAHKH